MDGKQGNEQEQKQPFPPQQGGEGRPIQSYAKSSVSRIMVQDDQEEMPQKNKSPSLSLSSSSNLLLDDSLLDDSDQQQVDEIEKGDFEKSHTQKDSREKIGEEIIFKVDCQKKSETGKSHGSTFSMTSDHQKQGQSLGDDQIRPESGREEEIDEEGNNDSNKVLEIESQEYATGRSAQIVQKEESNDKNAQNVESTSQKDTKTKVRDVARNRRRKARDWNEKKQAEIARLTKLNVQLKEKNQALINELIMLGVDTNTIQLFLNCLQVSTNQELTTSPVPSPQYKFSL